MIARASPRLAAISAIRADPSRAVGVDAVKARLAAAHEKASAKA